MATPATTCVWCGAPLGASAQRLAGRTLCAACGAATTDPWPDEGELTAAYGEWYRPDAGKRFAFGAGDAILGRTRGLLASRVDEIAPPGPIIDVGAGDGTLLDALERRGRDTLGLERNSAREDFRDASLSEIEGDGTWAAVILWHSLEHLPDPGAAIHEAARLLKPGGVIAVAVPNNDSLQARAISIREAALLQSFPDSYRFVGFVGDRFRQVGNAVPPLLAWAVAEAVLELLGTTAERPSWVEPERALSC